MQFQRRQSVLPTNRPTLRKSLSSCESNRTSYEASVDKRDSVYSSHSALSRLRRMSRMFKSQGPTEALKTVLGDPNRIRFMELSMEREKLALDLKQFSNFLDSLLTEYMEAKSLDVVRRYKKLQSIAKRIIFHLRLKDPASFTKFNSQNELDSYEDRCGSVLQSAVKQEALRAKHEMICDGFSSEELLVEIRKLEQQNQDLQERINGLVEAINLMDEEYQSCKGDIFIRRYLVLKTHVKSVFEKNGNLQ